MNRIVCWIVVAAALAALPSQGGQSVRGVLNQAAPSWHLDQWIQLPEGRETLDVSDYQGKVVYLYFFQSWCPGCHSHGFPTLTKLIERYQGDEAVAFATIQTTFEGFHANGPDDAERVRDKYKLKIPVGHSGSDGQRSQVMAAYRTGGTPWTVIIGPDGKVYYNDFHISVEQAVELIDSLKNSGV